MRITSDQREKYQKLSEARKDSLSMETLLQDGDVVAHQPKEGFLSFFRGQGDLQPGP